MIGIAVRRPSWLEQFWQDLQPTPGRLGATLRIVLSTVIALILLMTLRMSAASIGLYFIFLISRESPSVSFRSSIVSFIVVALAVAVELAVVILSDNDPVARLLSVAFVTFLAGMLVVGTNLPALGSSFGLIYCTVIAFWENHAPADLLVKASLKLLATFALSVACAVAVEYVFGVRDPAHTLEEQRRIRYRLLEKMFSLYAEGAPPEQIFDAATKVSRLAVAGQTGMMELYNAIVDRDLNTGTLPIGTRTRITMLAQLMDVSAAFGLQNLHNDEADVRHRCAYIAQHCHDLIADFIPHAEPQELRRQASLSLLDRTEAAMHAILTMPTDLGQEKNRELVALPSRKVPFFIPGAMTDRHTVGFGLKISLCATLCYIIYHAVDLPGISTSVITVIVTGLSSSGAIKQRLLYRLLGAVIGGLIIGLGATSFLFPHMDSITSLVVLIASVAMLSAWVAGGPRFGYVGLQIAFAFYIVALEGFGAPVQLEPARDRLVGILLALAIMWFVFDQMWPVRTVTVMRRAFASVLTIGSRILGLADANLAREEIFQTADILRDQVGKTVAGIRQMQDSVNYEFGSDREQQIESSETILRGTVTAAALFWNQLAALHTELDDDFVTNPGLKQMRQRIATHMQQMSEAVVARTAVLHVSPEMLCDPTLLASTRYGEYASNIVARYEELQAFASALSLQA